MVFASPLFAQSVFAATSSSKNTQAHGVVRAELNGKPISAISVGDTTYVDASGLNQLKTPNEYLGEGKYAITGGFIEGIQYQGKVYIPWNQLSAKMKAYPLKGGGFNFKPLPVKHNYHIEIDTQDTPAGSPAPMQVIVYDGNNPVPNQPITIHTNGFSSLTQSTGAETLHVTTDYSGTWFNGVNDNTQEQVFPTVTWTDPAGKTIQQTGEITFGAPTDTSTVEIPADDTAVASVPISVFANGIFFNATSGNDHVMLQLDTGAFEPLFTAADAKLLGLPNLGTIQVAGVGGEDNAYISEVSLNIGGKDFTDIPCIVDPNYTGASLFGYGFFQAKGYDILVSQKHNTLTIMK